MSSTTLAVSFDLGSRDDPPGQAGMCHLVEHLILSTPYDDTDLADAIQRIGGTIEASTGRGMLAVWAQLPDDHADELIRQIMAACEGSIPWGEDLVTREKLVIQEELLAARANPSERVQDRLMELLFGTDPMGSPVGGSLGSLQGIGRRDVLTYVDRVLRGCPRGVASVGRIRPEVGGSGVRQRARRDLRPAIPNSPDRPSFAAREGESRGSQEYTWTALGGVYMPTEEMRPSFAVLAALLDGNPSSVLYKALRRTEVLSYEFDAWVEDLADVGSFRIIFGADGDGAPATSAVMRELNRLAEDGPCDRDMSAAKAQCIQTVLRDTETPLGWARHMSTEIAIHGVARSNSDRNRSFRAVTRASVQSAARQILAGLQRATVFIGGVD